MTVHFSERNDHMYFTGGVSIIDPSNEEVAGLANYETVKRLAPNDSILWLSGEYMDSNPNGNGQAWTREEVAIKSLTPVLQPVTVMHDMSTAVGVIAQTSLFFPEETASQEPARLSTILAIWKHRFPEIAEEIKMNHDAGSLMQSMECVAPRYSCSECAHMHVKPVAEDQMCEHIRNGTAHRTLHDVTFTGTGLIFGSRGKVGAHSKAHLNLLDEVAAWSDERLGSEGSTKMAEAHTDAVSVPKAEYDTLVAKAAKADEVDAAKAAADDAKAAVTDAETKLTEAEVKVSELETENADLKTKVETFEATAAEDELASKRLSEMPAEVASKTPASVAERLAVKARKLTDEQWADEVACLAEMLKIDVSKSTEAAGTVFTETAMRKFNPQGGDTGTAASSMSIEQVGSGLAHMLKKSRTK